MAKRLTRRRWRNAGKRRGRCVCGLPVTWHFSLRNRFSGCVGAKRPAGRL